MSRKTVLEIKNWLGTGTGKLRLEIESFMLIERKFPTKTIQKLVVNRKPDRHSSRLGMMANLNKNNGSLSWGFSEMTLTIEEISDKGAIISSKSYDFVSIGVADLKMIGNEEEVTFVFAKKSEFTISQIEVSFD